MRSVEKETLPSQSGTAWDEGQKCTLRGLAPWADIARHPSCREHLFCYLQGKELGGRGGVPRARLCNEKHLISARQTAQAGKPEASRDLPLWQQERS